MNGGNRRQRRLSEDEEALWAYAMRDAVRYGHGAAAEFHAEAEQETPRAASTAQPASPMPMPNGGAKQQQHAPPAPRKPPPLSDLDRRQTRVIASGRASIDGRLDLHGMRQHEAHAALRSFLMSAHARGARVVLVITGKGARRSGRERDLHESMEQPGVLRRLTPMWLSEHDLRHIVMGYGPSSPHHGGDGALYVRLRRLRVTNT
ncbi:MAG: Smr/MutS family protein [Hyphomicrobiales bacterium]|nr:Smr/MutS family protein [Hyphomicrobiales bacterium]